MPYVMFSTRLGECGLAWNDAGLTGFQLPEDTTDATEHRLASRSKSSREDSPPGWVQQLVARVQRHLDGALQDFSDTAIDWSCASDFQQSVYREALAIKAGSTKSYGDLAHALGLGPGGARAVGVALATNPWPLIVPCHRIVSASGKMTGFSAPGGVRTKARLLVLEGAELLSE